jgi:hypothetical protein
MVYTGNNDNERDTMTFVRSTMRVLAEERNYLFREDDYIDTGDALEYISSLENALRVFANMNIEEFAKTLDTYPDHEVE